MDGEGDVDPRDRRLPPTTDEIEAWAAREHLRRAAWQAGPSAEEQLSWARRYRWRAALGLEESRVGPAPEDIERWAAREHKRREAWLAGPTEAEKQERVRRTQRGTGAPNDPSGPAPIEDDIEMWAAHESRRRQEWLAGPSAEEKRQWADRQTGGLFDEWMSVPAALHSELPETAQRLLRETELAGKGALYSLSRAPLMLWSHLIRAGKAFEKDFYQEPRRRRVPY